jgi:hypothetical protein
MVVSKKGVSNSPTNRARAAIRYSPQAEVVVSTEGMGRVSKQPEPLGWSVFGLTKMEVIVFK